MSLYVRMLRFVAIASASALLLGSAATSAQRRTAARIPGARLTEEPPPEYDAAIDEALAAYAAGQFEEALVAFRRANAIYPNARALRGIGMAAFEQSDYITAAEALEQALSHATRPLTQEQRQQVEQLYERARSFVGRFAIARRPGASLSVDGRDAAPAGWPNAAGVLWLVVGDHQLRVRDQSGHVAQLPVHVRAGDRADLDLDQALPLEQAVAVPTVPDERPPAFRAPETRSAPTGRDMTMPWVLVASGAGAAAVGAVLLVVGLGDGDSVTNAPRGTEWSTLEGANSRAPLLTGVGIALIAVGIAASGGGLVWVVTSSNGSTTEVAASPFGVHLRHQW